MYDKPIVGASLAHVMLPIIVWGPGTDYVIPYTVIPMHGFSWPRLRSRRHWSLKPIYYIVSSTDDSREYFIVVEKMTWWKAATWQLLFKICMMSVYYSFNIAYPTNLPVLLFLQHHVFEIRDNQPVPNIPLKIVYSAMCVQLSYCYLFR